METSNPEKGKKIWFRALIGFFVVMALLTFFSATLRNISLPRVTVSAPLSTALQKVVSANGAFEPLGSVSVDTDVACKVASVSVSAGDTVRKGDTLMTLDSDALSDLLEQEQDALAKLENNRKKMADSNVPQDLDQLQLSLDAANRNLAHALEDYNAVQANVSAGAADQAQMEAAGRALQAAQDDVKMKAAQLENAKEQNSRQSEAGRLDLANMDIDIAAQQKKVDELKSLADNGGKITSPIDGIVGQVNVQEGATASPGQPLAAVMDLSQGMKFEADISREDSELIPANAKMDIYIAGVSQRIPAELKEKKESADHPGDITIVLETTPQDIADLNIQSGQAGDIRYAQMTESYSMTVPNGAVREDSTGEYVLVADEKETPLGRQQVLRRVGVTVDDSDAFRSAVTGPLTPRDQVVSDSDKPVADGDAVLIGP
jgi:HlyD family secretion protein